MSRLIRCPMVKFNHPVTDSPCIALHCADRFYYDISQLDPDRVQTADAPGSPSVTAEEVRIVSDVNNALFVAAQAAVEAGGTLLTQLIGLSALEGTEAVVSHYSEVDRMMPTMTALRDFALETLRNAQERVNDSSLA